MKYCPLQSYSELNEELNQIFKREKLKISQSSQRFVKL